LRDVSGPVRIGQRVASHGVRLSRHDEVGTAQYS
jgi:hypothetical protein